MILLRVRVPGFEALTREQHHPPTRTVGTLRQQIATLYGVTSPFRLRTKAGALDDDGVLLGTVAEQCRELESASGASEGGSSGGGGSLGGALSPVTPMEASGLAVHLYCIFGAAWEAKMAEAAAASAALPPTPTLQPAPHPSPAVSAAQAAAGPTAPMSPMPPAQLHGLLGSSSSSSSSSGGGSTPYFSSGGGAGAGEALAAVTPTSPLAQHQEALRQKIETLAAAKAAIVARLTPRLTGLSPSASPALLTASSMLSAAAAGALPQLHLTPLDEGAAQASPPSTARRRRLLASSGSGSSRSGGGGSGGGGGGGSGGGGSSGNSETDTPSTMRRRSTRRSLLQSNQASPALPAAVAEGDLPGLPAAAPLPAPGAAGADPAVPAAAPPPPAPQPPVLLWWLERLQISLLFRLGLVCAALGYNQPQERLVQIATLLSIVYILNLGLLDVLVWLGEGLGVRCAALCNRCCRRGGGQDVAGAGGGGVGGAGGAGGVGGGGGAPPAPRRPATAFSALSRALTLGIGYFTCDVMAACLAFLVTMIPGYEADVELRPLGV